MRLEKRYKYFVLGLIVASVTWSVSLYLYWKLIQDANFQLKPTVGPLANVYPLFTYKKKFRSNDILIPFEDGDKERFRAKSKYYDPKKGIFRKQGFKKKSNTFPPTKENEFDGVALVKNEEDLTFRDEGYRLHGFNALASRHLDYHREVPDTRHHLCANLMYPNNLPNASIVICFYNEQFDTLARTLHSVIDRTPAHLLHEIILVDDNSDIEGLHNTIALYIKANLNGKVKLHLTKKREGLIRARIIGADLASGEVLVFLDSHVEVNKDWLQPMLQRISDNSSNVVTPIIDIINADTFQYSASPVVRGGFNWGLHFKWENLKPGSLRIDGDFVKPIKSPTMAGGLFAIDKNYFNAIGKYDPGMNIWGGENLEISFRIWQCGGSLEIIPCSRVGHVFRKRRPYSAPDGEDTMTRNSLRVAHVWMDEYKERYFKQRPEALRTQYGDITSRKELRSRLGCKSFSWYVQNIYPELLSNNNTVGYNPLSKDNNYIAHYQIRLSNSGLCIASEKDVKTKGSLLTLKTCLRIKNQMWSETERGEIKLAQYLCLDSGESFPKLSKCHEMGGTQEWKHKNQNASPIYNVAAGTCLSAESASVNSYINMQICTSQSNKQWDFVPLYS